MPRVAIKLTPSRRGGFYARKRIPADLRKDYQRLYGVEWEERFKSEPGIAGGALRRAAHEWAAEVDRRIGNLRALQRGEGQAFNREQARALAGEWYHWFTARHLAKPAEAIYWDHRRSDIQAALRDYVSGALIRP